MKTIIFKTDEDKWVEANASACDLCVVEEELYHQTGRSLWKGDFNVSIVGIRTPRSKNKVSDKFQDIIYFTWTEDTDDGEARIWYELPATTLAGRRMHNKPINSKGTAQLKCGFHPSLWKRGKHKGKNALIQIGNEVEGNYGDDQGYLKGTLNGYNLKGTYEWKREGQSPLKGDFDFTFTPNFDSFKGTYTRTSPDQRAPVTWNGTRLKDRD